jgi:5-methyltetrahydrofolate--homocysteine methyltransferase
MAIVGEKFKCNEFYVPQMLIAARAMKEAMAMLEPLLLQAGITPEHTVVVGTVQGDLHDIGKNLVAMMLKGANYGVVDMGTNVSAQSFVDAVKQNNAHVLGLSALLTTTMSEMKAAVAAMKDADLADVKIVIGGAPITQAYADQIGADGFAPDAATAVEVVDKVLAKAS